MNKDDWIVAEDGLPEHYQTVIVHGGCAFYDSGRKKWYSLMDSGHQEPKEIHWPVTHWMPLPVPPKDPQQQPDKEMK